MKHLNLFFLDLPPLLSNLNENVSSRNTFMNKWSEFCVRRRKRAQSLSREHRACMYFGCYQLWCGIPYFMRMEVVVCSLINNKEVKFSFEKFVESSKIRYIVQPPTQRKTARVCTTDSSLYIHGASLRFHSTPSPRKTHCIILYCMYRKSIFVGRRIIYLFVWNFRTVMYVAHATDKSTWKIVIFKIYKMNTTKNAEQERCENLCMHVSVSLFSIMCKYMKFIFVFLGKIQKTLIKNRKMAVNYLFISLSVSPSPRLTARYRRYKFS